MIAELLSRNPAQPITAAELAELLGTSRRHITKQIQIERLHGEPIVAISGNPGGYYYAENPEEIKKYIKALRRRCKELDKTQFALFRTYNEAIGQTMLPEWEDIE